MDFSHIKDDDDFEDFLLEEKREKCLCVIF